MIDKIMELVIFLFLGLILFGCPATKKENNFNKKIVNISNYIVVDSLILDDTGFWYDGQKIKNSFLAINKDSQSLEMYSANGKLLSYFGQKGNGPGEFQNMTRLDIYDNDIYLIDKQKFTVTHIILNETKLEYINEFKLIKQPTQICAINKDLLLITFPGDVNNLKLYTGTGKLLRQYSIPFKEKFKNDKECLNSNYWIDNNNDTNFVLGNIANMHLYFCEFDSTNYDIEMIKERKIIYMRKEKKYRYKNSNTRDVMGISPICHCNDNYFISLRSDMKGISETFFEIYDIKGNYIGNSNLKNYKAVYKVFSDNGDTLWFKTFDNYDYLYIAKREINEQIK